jgi:hypothetical protein
MKTIFPIIICISTSVCWVDNGLGENASGYTQPPARYAIEPPIPVIDNVLDVDEVNVKCKEIGAVLPPGVPYLLGCAHPTPTLCTIYRINDTRIKTHELGHCNGWPGYHPNEAELQEAEAKPRGRLIGDVWCGACSVDGTPAPPFRLW